MAADGNWQNKKVTILGLGRSGVSAALYLKERGAEVFVSESSPQQGKEDQVKRLEEAGVRVETGGHSEEAIAFGDFVLISPGISPSTMVVQKARSKGKEVICDIELAYRDSKTPIIAITGTNGKSTTCALISHILTTAGFNAPACGNFGVPILSELAKNPDYLVVEVSSFQAYYSPKLAPAVAVWLNLTPDHLEWHGSLDAYIEAKKKIFLNQRGDQYAVLNEDDPIVSTFYPPSEIMAFSVESNLSHAVQGAYINRQSLFYRYLGSSNFVCNISDLKIIGKHNLENALAAIAVCAVLLVPHEKIVEGLKSFTALEHRLEFVATIDGVDYFNDSKATNPTSTIKALEAFEDQKIVLIAGGRDKGTPLNELVEAMRKHVSAVILLGEAKERFARACNDGGFRNVQKVESLEQAVEVASTMRQGPVVLSPACASFDMFKDYEERGRVFKDLVRSRLEKVASSR